MSAPPQPEGGLPANVEVEQALLSAIFANNEALDAIPERLGPEHFADPLHARIFALAQRRHQRGEAANAVTLYQVFEGEEAEPALPVKHYLAQLQGAYVPAAQAPDYARTILDDALRRAAIQALEEAQAALWKPAPDEELAVTLDRLQGRLDGALSERGGGGGPQALARALQGSLAQAERVLKADGRLVGVPTGLASLDGVTMGLQPGELVVVAARPGMGKSAFAQTVAHNAAGAGKRVLWFSLEMSATELGVRALARASGIDSNDIRGNVTPEIMDRLFEAERAISDLPIVIDDSPALTAAQMRSRARRLRRKGGLDLILVDYIQLMRGSAARRRNDTRVQEVTEISGDLKALAKDLDLPVMALSQLSRETERREDKRPQLSDLRESGSIEQDADAVLFLYRDDYYLSREPPKARPNESDEVFEARQRRHGELLMKARGIAEVIVAKQRQGPAPRTVRVRFEARTTAFADLYEVPAREGDGSGEGETPF